MKRKQVPKSYPEGDNVFVSDYIDFHGGNLFHEVKDSNRRTLFEIPLRDLQRFSRDVFSGVITRRREGKPIGSLLPKNLQVIDHRVILPKISESDGYDYERRVEEFFVAVFPNPNAELADFLRKLRQPQLKMRQFESLYFHYFLLNEEQRADFVKNSVDNLRNKRVIFKGSFFKWEVAYEKWEAFVNGGSNKKYDLLQASTKDSGAAMVWNFKSRRNPGNCVDEAEFGRNIVHHINERREKATPPMCPLDKNQIGHAVHRVMPGINSKLFDFMFDCYVDMDFDKVLVDPPKSN
ncbi:hypothetical protein RchiOBHm_Chr2g0088841 [Rosa chinensis]|uniref:Uncharacterized protein n=1 Tax=Rosa chinensis TaxID=74649 RepID=A0A2P6RJ18_ROSCH|nr:uncharacterized protein LOC121051420 [Rosa chinensis]PRQ46414.1 hypothetical protein RchiOBHm_Chr2g0088841 [Rosa chinensis]